MGRAASVRLDVDVRERVRMRGPSRAQDWRILAAVLDDTPWPRLPGTLSGRIH